MVLPCIALPNCHFQQSPGAELKSTHASKRKEARDGSLPMNGVGESKCIALLDSYSLSASILIVVAIPHFIPGQTQSPIFLAGNRTSLLSGCVVAGRGRGQELRKQLKSALDHVHAVQSLPLWPQPLQSAPNTTDYTRPAMEPEVRQLLIDLGNELPVSLQTLSPTFH